MSAEEQNAAAVAGSSMEDVANHLDRMTIQEQVWSPLASQSDPAATKGKKVAASKTAVKTSTSSGKKKGSRVGADRCGPAGTKSGCSGSTGTYFYLRVYKSH